MTATACHCTRCLVERAGLPPGPYTPAQFALIAPPTVLTPNDDPVADDPGVKAAQLESRTAREEWEPLDQAWRQALATHRAAEMPTTERSYTDGRGGLFTPGAARRRRQVAELAEQVKDTREAMELAWKDVVRANDRVRAALLAARARVAEAERAG